MSLTVSSLPQSGLLSLATASCSGTCLEHHSFGENEETAGDYAEELAAEMLATTLGLDFDPDESWDEKKEVYRLSNQIVRTQNVTQTAVGDKSRLWTTVIAVACAGWMRHCAHSHPQAWPVPCPVITSGVMFLLTVSAGPVHAQVFERVGTRALGMGGAFVAVADGRHRELLEPRRSDQRGLQRRAGGAADRHAS